MEESIKDKLLSNLRQAGYKIYPSVGRDSTVHHYIWKKGEVKTTPLTEDQITFVDTTIDEFESQYNTEVASIRLSGIWEQINPDWKKQRSKLTTFVH